MRRLSFQKNQHLGKRTRVSQKIQLNNFIDEDSDML